MKSIDYAKLLFFGITTILFERKKTILATIILTDKCNLSCKHCAVNNKTYFMESYESVKQEMQRLYQSGNRILFFCGGETFLWNDGEKSLVDLVIEAKRIGFYLVNIVTNGLSVRDIPEVDVIFLSLDGMRCNHDNIRGETFDKILEMVRNTKSSNICVYMAINNLNYLDVEALSRFVQEEDRLHSISFNFHTPYPGTEHLSMSEEQKKLTANKIINLIDSGLPIFNIKSGLIRYIEKKWKRPSSQCLVSEKGVHYTCGRCIAEPGLCENCGYLFAVEFSLIFDGHIPSIIQMLKNYRRFVS